MMKSIKGLLAAVLVAAVPAAAAEDIAVFEQRRPVNTVQVSGTPSKIEYSACGALWNEIPFIQLGGKCYFESVDARMLKISGDALISDALYSTEALDALDAELAARVRALKKEIDAFGESGTAAELTARCAELEKISADPHFSRYNTLQYRQELENFMEETEQRLHSFTMQLTAARRAILDSISGSFVYSQAIDKNVQSYMDGMSVPSSAEDTLWSDITGLGTQSASLTLIYRRIETMALAYQCGSSTYYKTEELLSSIKSALEAADKYWYNENTEMYGNWWDFLIGVPSRYCKILTIIRESLTEEERTRYANALQHFCRYEAYSGAAPKPGEEQAGANLVNISNYDYIMGVFTENESKIENAAAKFYSVFDYKADGSGEDGFYDDGSFLQHGVPYNGSYGREFFKGVVDMAESLNGTIWGFGEEHFARVNEWIEKGYLPFVFKSSMMDIVNGRAIVRNNADKSYGYEVGRTILHYASMLDDDDYKKSGYCETVKYWFLNSSPSNGVTWESDCDELSRSMIENSSYDAADHTPLGVYAYPNMDRAVYRPSESWAAGIAMSSSRVPTYELTNGENTKGWYTGSGALYLYNEDDAHYSKNYWTAADMYSIPGTTVDSTVRYYDGEGNHYQDGDGEGCPDSDFAGTLTDGSSGAAAMLQRPVNVPTLTDLTAKKSYFMVTDGILCMGTGISGGTGEVYTTVENRAAEAGEYTLYADGVPTEADGRTAEIITLALSGSTGNIGWYFPFGAEAELKHEVRTASPSEVRKGSTDPEVTKGFVTLKLKHGETPHNASYCYMLLPDKTAEQTQVYASEPSVKVLCFEDSIHAVYDYKSGKTFAVFYGAGSVEAENGLSIACSAPAIAEVSDNGDIYVCDPSQKLTSLTLTISGGYSYAESENASVREVDNGSVIIEFNLSGSTGKTIKLEARK